MKKQQRTGKRQMYIVLPVVLAVILSLVYSRYGGFGTGPCADIEEFTSYAVPVSEITVPDGIRIVALGEATHGNQEFQELKLTVFQNLVEDYKVRAFALEGDYGGCEAVNRYIHGGDGTAKEAAAAIGFAIYRTEEMEDLISWMRTYNKTAASGEDLCFYGFDMQRYEHSWQYLLEDLDTLGIDVKGLPELTDDGESSFEDADTVEQRVKILNACKENLSELQGREVDQAIHFADVLLQNTELGQCEAGEYNALRDRMMADNITWILQQEEKRGNSCIFLSGHNGHVERTGSYGTDKAMGALLADEYGEQYYVIGTDFYRSFCNLPKGSYGGRGNYLFYSHDPLAKASKKSGFEASYLAFDSIPDSSDLKELVSAPMWMGSLGELYSPIMEVFPMSYRVKKVPEDLYDAMIFVSEAHPTEIQSE